MAKSWNYGKKNKSGSFSQKKKELSEYEDLESSGFLQEISNNKRFSKKLDYLEEQYENLRKLNKQGKISKRIKLVRKYRPGTMVNRHRQKNRVSRIRETL